MQTEEVSDLTIKGVRPDVRVRASVDQLRVDPDPVTDAAHRPLEHMSNAKSGSDLAQIAGTTAILPNGGATDHFQVGHLGQVRQNVVLNAIGEIRVGLIVTQVFERKNGDAFVGNARDELLRIAKW